MLIQKGKPMVEVILINIEAVVEETIIMEEEKIVVIIKEDMKMIIIIEEIHTLRNKKYLKKNQGLQMNKIMEMKVILSSLLMNLIVKYQRIVYNKRMCNIINVRY